MLYYGVWVAAKLELGFESPGISKISLFLLRELSSKEIYATMDAWFLQKRLRLLRSQKNQFHLGK